MTIFYKKYKFNNSTSRMNGKIYARAVKLKIIDLDGLAEHMSDHNSPYSKGVIKGILTDMVSCIKELVLASNQVKLDDLGIFYPSVVTNKPADTAAAFTVSENIKGAKIGCRATGSLATKSLSRGDTGVEFREYTEYTSPTDDTSSSTEEPSTGE